MFQLFWFFLPTWHSFTLEVKIIPIDLAFISRKKSDLSFHVVTQLSFPVSSELIH